MKSYNHLYEVAISEETRKKAVHNVIRGRHKMRHLERFSADENLTVQKSEQWIREYKNARHHKIQIYDGIKRKKREIIVPTFEELTVQHCIIEAIRPMLMHGMYEHTYASIPGRGVHKAKKAIRKWVDHDARNCKYVLKMDIKQFFPSIPHDKLKKRLANQIHDEHMLELMYEIIDVIDIGLPLGFYTSQWLSNWYLQPLDHYIKEELAATHYVRYMDDMVVFSSNKRKLHKMRLEIERYLQTELGLELNSIWQVFRFDYIKDGKHRGRDLDFMGFRFWRDRTTLRRSIWYNICRKARKIGKKNKVSIYDARQMLAALGWIKATNVYAGYMRFVRPYVNFQTMKRKISLYDRRRTHGVADSVWISTGISG